MHRNTYIASPLALKPTLQSKIRDDLFFGGQLIGVEGYLGNIASGWLAGINASRWLTNEPLITLPQTTMFGALLHYVTTADVSTFQPMKANFGLLPELPENIPSKRGKNQAMANRSQESLESFISGTML